MFLLSSADFSTIKINFFKNFLSGTLSKCQMVWTRRSVGPGPKVIKLFPCSIQLSTIFILLINVKMATIVGILTFISMINTTSVF